MQSTTMQDGQSFISNFQPTDAQNNPGQTIGNAAWASADPTIATATQNPDNLLQATIKAIGPGTTNITCTVESSTTTIVATSEQVIVNGGPATGGTFSNTTPA